MQLLSRRRRTFALLLSLAIAALGSVSPAATRPAPAAIALTQITAARAQSVLRALFPDARITIDPSANAVVVIASPKDLEAIRAVVAGIDVKSAIAPTVEAIPLRSVKAGVVASRVHTLFPSARVVEGPYGRSLIVSATPADMPQIKAIVAAMDTPALPPPVAGAGRVTESYRVTQASPDSVARAIAGASRAVRVNRSGATLLISGPPDEVVKAKDLAASLDQPPPGVRYTQLYRVRSYDATSVGDFISRSYPNVTVRVDKELNAITVFGTGSEQRQVSKAVDQLDSNSAGAGGVAVAQAGAAGAPIGGPGGTVQVYSLKSAVPGINGAASTSATDIASTVTQALSASAPDLRITVMPSTNQLIMTGSPYSLQLARDLIDQLDVAQKLVVMDTQIVEVDETVAKDLGISFSNPQVISTVFTEATPGPDAAGNPQRLLGLAPLIRTPLTLGVQLNLALSTGKGRILSNPRITTISGRTATIRAGDTISVQTTAGGGAGTVATTQLQTFQTGVTLDITPIVNAGDLISVLLHPTVNSETGILNGIPQISTRDTQTTVALRDGETLVIGGLIQHSSSRTYNKIPILGDIPLIGSVFRENIVNNQDNELIITVTPHIVVPGVDDLFARRGLPNVPTQGKLPHVPLNYTPPPAAPDVQSAIPPPSQPQAQGPAFTPFTPAPVPVAPPDAPALTPPPSPSPRPRRQAAPPTPAPPPLQTPIPGAATTAQVPGGPVTTGVVPGGPTSMTVPGGPTAMTVPGGAVATTVPGGPAPAGATVPGGPAVGTPVPGGPSISQPSGVGPRATPTPVAVPTPQSFGGGVPAATAAPKAAPMGIRGNAWVYGEQPADNVAGPADPLRIFYADLSPLVVHRDAVVFVNATTTTNTVQVTLTDALVRLQLSQVAPGRWSARFPFPAGSAEGTHPLTLTAFRNDGVTKAITFSVSVSQ